MYSRLDLAGSNGQSNFSFNFGYLSESHIHVYIDTVETTAFTFNSAFVVHLTTALNGAHTVRVKRITPIDEPLVTFTNGSVLGDSDLNTGDLQILYSQQELADDAVETATLTIHQNNAGEWDALNAQITNVLDPVSPQDAVTKAYLDAQYAQSPAAHSLFAHTDTIPTDDSTAGDMLVGNNSAPSKMSTFPIGADLSILEVDLSQTFKMRWRSLVSKLFQLLTTKGDLLVSTGATTQRKAVGTNDYVLVADSTQGDGLIWKDPTTITPMAAAISAVQAQSNLANPLMNGNMGVWQRGITFASAANGQYTADRFSYRKSNAGVVTWAQSSDTPTAAEAGVKLPFSLALTVGTADAANDATDYAHIKQVIEGNEFAPYGQRAMVLSFWVKSSKTGIYCVNFGITGPKEYIAEYTINSANTWERKTIAMTATPTAITSDYNSGLEVTWSVMCGANYQSTKDSWLSTAGHYATSSQVNCLDNVANTFFLTGIQFEPGTTASPTHAVGFATELERCRRYYQKSFYYADVPRQNAGIINAFVWPSPVAISAATIAPFIPYTPAMRQNSNAPTFYNPGAANGEVRNLTDSADCTATTYYNNGENGTSCAYTSTAGTAVGEKMGVHWTQNADF